MGLLECNTCNRLFITDDGFSTHFCEENIASIPSNPFFHNTKTQNTMNRNIVECDRCNAKITELKTQPLGVLVESEWEDKKCTLYRKEIDLCDDCVTSLKKWLGGTNPLTGKSYSY